MGWQVSAPLGLGFCWDFWGSNFRPLEDSGIYIYIQVELFLQKRLVDFLLKQNRRRTSAATFSKFDSLPFE